MYLKNYHHLDKHKYLIPEDLDATDNLCML